MKKLSRYAKENRRKKTPAEKKLFVWLQRWKIQFASQRPFDRYIVDFLILDRRLIVELDGPYHDFQKEKDLKRTRYLEAKGFTVIRFPNKQVFENPDSVRVAIESFPIIPRPDPKDWMDLYGVAAF